MGSNSKKSAGSNTSSSAGSNTRKDNSNFKKYRCTMLELSQSTDVTDLSSESDEEEESSASSGINRSNAWDTHQPS